MQVFNSTYISKLYRLATSLNYSKSSVHNILDICADHPRITPDDMISSLRKKKYLATGQYVVPSLACGLASTKILHNISLFDSDPRMLTAVVPLMVVAILLGTGAFGGVCGAISNHHSYNSSIKLVKILDERVDENPS